MSGQRCPNCGGYSWDNGKCTNCGHVPNTGKPRFDMGNVDIFELAKGLERKKEENRRAKIPTLNNCPFCKIRSLFYDRISDLFECMNQTCGKHKIQFKNGFTEYNNILAFNHIEILTTQIHDYKPIEIIKTEIATTNFQEVPADSMLHNPLLLSVKMFLSDIRTWRNQYIVGEYVCADFSKEVVSKATEREMRCGYVVIRFEKSNVGHAIVAFETDYGLVFIEPQSGEQVDIHLGRPYNSVAKGFEENNIINSVEIQWNDGTGTRL